MTFWNLLMLNLAAAAAVMVLAWATHLLHKKASVVDAFWGPGFALVAWLSLALSPGPAGRQTLIALVVSVWALRLAWHVTRRNRGKPEDPRYARMRQRNPQSFWYRSLFTVFLLQAAVLWVVALPVQLGMRPGEGVGLLGLLGLLIWGFGFFWEAVGDEQLYRFKQDPANAGKVLDSGLWRYTRHPNYFGEAVMWWGVYLMACQAHWGWLSFPGPLLLTFLLLRVSGVSLTEKMMDEKHTRYTDYKRRTSAFVPLPPRSEPDAGLGIRLAEAGLVPDALLRAVIRSRLGAVLRREDPGTAEGRQEALRAFIASMQGAAVAPAPQDSNRQHYEVPPAFFREMLGPWLKYSGCLWPEHELGRRPDAATADEERRLLARAEEDMLELTAGRAQIRDGMRILDLGCGWGSFSLWAARRFPAARIWAVSNAAEQGAFIRARAADMGLDNVTALTAEMNDFTPPAEAGPFHRVVSVEMFEHMRNWPELLRRIASWLDADGRFFMHVFSHRELAYPYRQGPGEWMSEHFFTGGMMPADTLPLHLQQDLVLEDHWRVGGQHYARTLYSWLALLDGRRDSALDILERSGAPARLHLQRWRMFLMACGELFGYRHGNEWLVSHYLWRRR